MNKRIDDIKGKTLDLVVPYTWHHLNHVQMDDILNKFAELIVRECMDIAYEYDAPKMSGPGMIIAGRIEDRLGAGMSTEDKKTLIKELLGVNKDADMA